MIQYAKDEHRTALMHLWKLCFSDTNKFIRFYFDKIYKPEETLIVTENGIPVASLQIIPHTIKSGQKQFLAGYISGAMTHPDYRRKNHMQNLLFFAFEEMKKKGYAATFLIPQEEWLFGFYEKYGYKKAFPEYPSTSYNCDTIAGEKHPWIVCYSSLQEIHPETLYLDFNMFLLQKENVVLKSLQQFSSALEEHFLEHGTIFAGKEGIAFAQPEGETVWVKAFFYKNEQILHQFLATIAHHYPNKDMVVLDSDTTSPSYFSGMIKALNDTISLPENIYMNLMLD